MERKMNKCGWIFLDIVHALKKEWKPHNINAVCWTFYCVKDNAKVNGQKFQIMRCHICHKNLVHISNPKTQLKKGVIKYKNNGIKKLKNM